MKIRNGFVSNSSSSSFVIVCKEHDHKRVLEKIHPYYKQWISEYLNPTKQKFADINILVFSAFISSEDEEAMFWEGEYPKEAKEYCSYNEDDKTEKYVPGSTIINIYVKELKKISSEVVFEEIGC